jgi:GPH family glycoside/pentoside/hexuronide:cation symporter
MRLAYILVPTVGALLAIWVMRDYDVNEARAKEIRAELESRRGKTLVA